MKATHVGGVDCRGGFRVGFVHLVVVVVVVPSSAARAGLLACVGSVLLALHVLLLVVSA
jgi:hypothetical protein